MNPDEDINEQYQNIENFDITNYDEIRNFDINNNYDEIENIDINSDDSYLNVLQKLQMQCKKKIQNYQKEHHLRTDYYHLFSNSNISRLINNEDDLINNLNMNNPEESELFFDHLQSLLNRNFIENRKYEIFDDCCEIKYDTNAFDSAQNCENNRNYLQEKNYTIKKNEIIDYDDNNYDYALNDVEKRKIKKKNKKKNYTFSFMTREPPKDIIHKNYNNYLLELEEKKKQEDSKNFKFIAKPCPSDILAP
eukprot:jgi/Orpsp1_1/1187217/evm.model.d7180000056160.1